MKSIAIVLTPVTGTGKRTLYADLIGPQRTLKWRVPAGFYFATFATFSGVLKNGKPSGKRLSANQSVAVRAYSPLGSAVNLTLGPTFHFIEVFGADNSFLGTGKLFASKCVTTHRVVVVAMDSSARTLIGVNAPVASLKSDDPRLTVHRNRSAGHNAYDLHLAAIPDAGALFDFTVAENPKSGPTKKYADSFRVNGDVCGVMTEFPIPTASSQPVSIASGSDGNAWFLEKAANKIGRITATGLVTEFSNGLTGGSGLQTITGGPDRALWFTEYIANKIGRIDTSGAVTEYSTGLTAASSPDGITAGPDKALWFTEYAGNRIGRITTAGAITEFPTTTNPSNPVGIAVGPQTVSGAVSALWFAESTGKIGTILTSGTITEFPLTWSAAPYSIAAIDSADLMFTDKATNSIGEASLFGVSPETLIPTANSLPQIAATGPDGAVWFTETSGNKIGRIDTSGTITEYPIPTVASDPVGIVTGPDGSIWFTEQSANKIGRLQ